MIRIRKIAHVAVAVDDIDAALERYRHVFGLVGAHREIVASQKTEAVLLPMGETSLELVSPRGNEALAKFVEGRGGRGGLHHVALEVEGLDAALAWLKGIGVPLIDETPRIGAQGHRVAFVHPKATGGVLIELVEAATTDQPAADHAAPDEAGRDATGR